MRSCFDHSSSGESVHHSEVGLICSDGGAGSGNGARTMDFHECYCVGTEGCSAGNSLNVQRKLDNSIGLGMGSPVNLDRAFPS